MFPSRLSFLRTLLRRLSDEQAQIRRPVWEIDADGYGHAVYTLTLGGHCYALVAFSDRLDPAQRTDRVIAEAWDSAFVLYDGLPDEAEIARLKANAPLQEAGRFTARDLVLSRANKSVRLFAHVAEALRLGHAPDAELVGRIGYLMRTTAVYGNGKFGIADRALIASRPGMEMSFMAEMLTVWLIRHFTHDLVEHVGGAALDVGLKRFLGIGNSTGLGMAPFLVNHPVLLNNWMLARETALARVRAIEQLSAADKDRLKALMKRATQHLKEWNVPDPEHQARIEVLRRDWAVVGAGVDLDQKRPLDAIMTAVEAQSLDIQELMAALVIEPFGDLVDGLTECMGDPFGPFCTPMRDVSDLRAAIEQDFQWALAPDYEARAECAQFWYVSEAKQEPRLGLRFEEEGAELESPLDIARRIKALSAALERASGKVADFLETHPEHAMAVSRVAMGARYPYGEIRDNLIAETCLPIDMLRCKLSFFGASKFDPKSDRWTRITLCQGAPLASDLQSGADDWWLPVFAP
jgi:predicted nucleic acid-binding protein